jgi:prephenate dehydrogenase
MTHLSSVEIIGSGLIGTSIGLALAQNGVQVSMKDLNERAQVMANDLVGGTGIPNPEVIVIAVPISAFAGVLKEVTSRDFKGVVIDVASIKTKAKLEVSSFPSLVERFVPTHPMAGREIGGVDSARSDLFEGRAWIIDTTSAAPDSIAIVKELIALLGAVAVEMDSIEHDEAVALISHLPQLLSSLLASQLQGKPENWLHLAGGGLRDTTRIAASDPALWREIISQNSAAILPLLQKVSIDLQSLISKISDESVVEAFISSGQKGRALIPGKHGGKARDYTFLPIVIEDKPGQLAAIFEECATAGVNIEDLSIEHSPGQETGLITLALNQSDAVKLSEHLTIKGWNVHSPRK